MHSILLNQHFGLSLRPNEEGSIPLHLTLVPGDNIVSLFHLVLVPNEELTMRKFGGGSLIVTAVVLVIIGVLLQGFIANVVEVLVKILGVIFVLAGVVMGIMGIIRLFTGGKR